MRPPCSDRARSPSPARRASYWLAASAPLLACGRGSGGGCGETGSIETPPRTSPAGAGEGAPRTVRFGWRNREKRQPPRGGGTGWGGSASVFVFPPPDPLQAGGGELPSRRRSCSIGVSRHPLRSSPPLGRFERRHPSGLVLEHLRLDPIPARADPPPPRAQAERHERTERGARALRPEENAAA